jgi:hypothetical protein
MGRAAKKIQKKCDFIVIPGRNAEERLKRGFYEFIVAISDLRGD